MNIVKVKWSRYRPGVAQRVGRGIALLFHDRGTRRWWVVSSTPWPHFTPGKTRYPFYRRLGGPQGQSGRAENLVPTGIRSWTVQPVASPYRLSYSAHIMNTVHAKIDWWYINNLDVTIFHFNVNLMFVFSVCTMIPRLTSDPANEFFG